MSDFDDTAASGCEEVRPWRRTPTCSVCDHLAEGVTGGRFYCSPHYERALAEVVLSQGWASGRTRARAPWGYWLRSLYWRPRYHLSPRRRLQRREQELLLRKVFR